MIGIQKITDRVELGKYCLRQLGAPVVIVNVDETQVDDRINDALQMFYNYHMDGSEKSIVVHQLTQDDITNQFIKTPDNTITVTEILESGTNSGSFGNNLQMQMYFTDMISNATRYGMSTYVVTKSYLNMFNDLVNNTNYIINHNVNTQKLKIMWDWNSAKVGQYIVYEAYIANDIDEALNSYWLKQYTTALIRKQWANNLIKVTGMQLPGGGMLNGSEMLQQANQEIETLETRLKEEFSVPIMAFMG